MDCAEVIKARGLSKGVRAVAHRLAGDGHVEFRRIRTRWMLRFKFSNSQYATPFQAVIASASEAIHRAA